MKNSSLLKTTFLFRCPHCGEGSVFSKNFRERQCCKECSQPFGNDTGNFLGAMIVNHFAVALVVILFAICQFQLDNTVTLVRDAIVLSLILTVLVFPFAKAFWVGVCVRFQKD